MPDGTSAALYQRDPEKFRDLLKRTAEIHAAASSREWPRLAAEYRAALDDDHLARRPGRRPSSPWMGSESESSTGSTSA